MRMLKNTRPIIGLIGSPFPSEISNILSKHYRFSEYYVSHYVNNPYIKR